ncbi:MAG: MBL fold hydrolase [Candidatus Methanogaster sp.]|uniref:MBL fold hydrolase n=1 Tax=Candidatus Methanogaster sp. TaxID=3386292 RepID=A0AC61L612_9EURY|nr:MAG: MBL fold hydrolase [ANME-2 cluster archaeon]
MKPNNNKLDVQRFALYANAYLLDGTVLIDTGIDPWEVAGYDLELIILTHCHFDHTCAASDIADMTGAKIAIHETDARLLDDDCATASVLFGKRAPEISPDMLLHGGEIFESDNFMLEVLHTPGHTPGGICLYESETRSLFSGDTIFPAGGIGRCDLGGDLSDLIHSIKLLTTLDPEVLYPGHLDVTDVDIPSQIRSSLARARELTL